METQSIEPASADPDDEIFKSEDEMKSSMKVLCHGDLYVIGRLWIEALKTVLVGAKLSLIPVVHAAAKEPDPPSKPPPMKYEDLPMYPQPSPHFEYNDYITNKEKFTCPTAKVKLLHEYLYPKVQTYRKEWKESVTEFLKDAGELKNDGCAAFCKKKQEFKSYMRDPENMAVRQAVMALGTITGYYIGSGKGLPRRFFFTSLGALSAGALCFPKETDEAFRTVSYHVGKLVIAALNKTCGHNFRLRERLPCPDDMPAAPPTRASKCTK